MRKVFVLVLLSLTMTASAQDKASPKPAKKARQEIQDARNFRITFTMKSHSLFATGNFVVMAGSQANYVLPAYAYTSSSDAVTTAGYDNKFGAIINCMPVPNPNNGLIRAECEFQLAAPGVIPAPPQPTEPLHLQTTFEAKLGRKLVLIDEGRRYVEVKFDEVTP